MSRTSTALSTIAVLLVSALAGTAEPQVKELRTQKVGDTTYFEVSLTLPPGCALPPIPKRGPRDAVSAEERRGLARLPRLVPRDGQAAAVCYQMPYPLVPAKVGELTFLGKLIKDGPADFLLLYPVETELAAKAKEALAPALFRWKWVEELVTLDFQKAKPRDHLQGRWAEAQARQLAVLEALSDGFGFYGLARELTARKYDVTPVVLHRQGQGDAKQETMRLYEMTTGAAALTESLATHRLLPQARARDDRRTHDVADIRGVEVAEHPWEKMMAGKKPAAEPVAKLIPHDNYYVAFKSIRKFIEFGELAEQWGAPMIQAYDVSGRDFNVKSRYEKQLCLRSTLLGKTLGPALIRGIAVTGNDPYLREGSDVSVLFEVRDRGLFLTSVEPFLHEARKEHGKELREEKSEYRGVTINSFTTPLREVSLHRAAFDTLVVYSNSSVALRRILDAHAGKRKTLAESLDFQYMRTVFRADDKDEDGFVFFPDAFIRQLVGPASKVKEKRRLEALTSLQMVTHGALFAAWETGKLPADLKALLRESRLSADEIVMPQGKGVEWDAKRQTAISDVYNTIHFTTPLVELPIDKLTTDEVREYQRFREGYLTNWRQYFDPVGLRLHLKDDEVRLEVYILPLIASSEYNQLRQMSGGGVARLDTGLFSPRTLFQFSAHLAPNQRQIMENVNKPKPLGDLFFVRLEDSPVYRDWVRLLVAGEVGDAPGAREYEEERLFWQTPAVFGIKIDNEKVFDDLLRQMRGLLDLLGASQGIKLAQDGLIKPDYKGVAITALRFDPDCDYVRKINPMGVPAARLTVPGVYHAKLDGMWYASLSLPALHALIDDARQEGKKPAREIVQMNSGVYLSPKAAVQAAGVLPAYLEWQGHKQTLAGTPLWLALYRAGVLPADAPPATAEATAKRFFGFVPASPDRSAYRFEPRTAEVVNARHGSMRQPRLHDTLGKESPMARVLEQVPSLRADLRFREDGIHTVVTLKRLPAKK